MQLLKLEYCTKQQHTAHGKCPYKLHVLFISSARLAKYLIYALTHTYLTIRFSLEILLALLALEDEGTALLRNYTSHSPKGTGSHPRTEILRNPALMIYALTHTYVTIRFSLEILLDLMALEDEGTMSLRNYTSNSPKGTGSQGRKFSENPPSYQISPNIMNI